MLRQLRVDRRRQGRQRRHRLRGHPSVQRSRSEA